MTTDLLDSFVLDAWDALARLQTATGAYASSSQARADAALFTHRLRGTAALYGFNGVAGIAQLTEGLLERSPRLPQEEWPRIAEFLGAATAVIHDALLRVAKGEEEGNLGLELGRLDGSALLHDLLRQVPDAFVREEIVEAAEEDEQQSLAQYLPEFRASHDDTWSFFAPEAGEHIEAIYDGLKQADRQGQETEALTALFRATHTLKGAAYMVNLRPLGELAHALEDLMMAVRDGGRHFSSDIKTALRRGAAALSTMLRAAEGEQTQVDQEVAELEGLLSGLLERELTLGARPDLGQKAPGQKAFVQGGQPAEDALAAELAAFARDDAETWEYFGPEVKENLDLYGAALAKLRGELSGEESKEALAEMRRAAHTLKGSSLMVGFPHMDRPAKGLEYLATAVREGELAATEEVLAAMQDGHALLSAMFEAAEGKPSSLGGPTDELVHRLNRLLGQEEALPESEAPPEPELAPDKPVQVATVRVAVDKLDTLMNLAGELVSARARMGSLLEQFGTLSQDFLDSRARLNRTVEDFSERHLNPRFQGGVAPSAEGAKSFNVGERFEELEFDTYSDLNILSRSVTEMANDLSEVQNTFNNLGESLDIELEGVRKLTRELRASASRARMVPIGTLFSRMGRLLSDPGDGKRFRLEVAGETVEVDNTILEAITDPMLHLVKNSLVHGLEAAEARAEAGKDEEGVISLGARLIGNQVVVTVEDDGRGVDVQAVKAKAVERGLLSQPEADALSRQEALELIFAPGLSTASEVTQDAGRGVGMDAVAEGIRGVRGDVEVISQPGKGSRFILRLPLTLLISDVLVANVGPHRLAFSASGVRGLRAFTEADLGDRDGSRYAVFEGQAAELVDLRELFGSPANEQFTVIFAQSGTELIALAADDVSNLEEVMVRGLSGLLSNLAYLAGATIDSQGQVIPIYDPAGLQRLARSGFRAELAVAGSEAARQHLLVVDDSLSVRKVLATMLRRSGFEISTAVDGQDALDKLRGEAFDAVLTDLEMPRLNGYELIEEVRRRDDADLPVIVMTTRAASKHMNLAIELGANAYLTKPVDEAKLLGALARAFNKEGERALLS